VIRSTKNPTGFPWSSVYRLGLSSVRPTFTSRVAAAAGQQSAATRNRIARTQSSLFRFGRFRFFLSAGKIIEGISSDSSGSATAKGSELLCSILRNHLFFWWEDGFLGLSSRIALHLPNRPAIPSAVSGAGFCRSIRVSLKFFSSHRFPPAKVFREFFFIFSRL